MLGDWDRLGLLLVESHLYINSFLAKAVQVGLGYWSPWGWSSWWICVHMEAPQERAAEDFVASMTTTGLSQVISGPTLDLVFCLGHGGWDWKVVELSVAPLSWTKYYLVNFVLSALPKCYVGSRADFWACPWKLMDFEGFLSNMVLSKSVGAMSAFWNMEAVQAVDKIIPKCRGPEKGARKAPWFTEDLQVMKWFGHHLELSWRKSKVESI